MVDLLGCSDIIIENTDSLLGIEDEILVFEEIKELDVSELEVTDSNLTLILSAEELKEIVPKFNFLSKAKLSTEQLLNIVCISGFVFIVAETVKFFYSTVMDAKSSTADMSFAIPFKQFRKIVTASTGDITFKNTENLLSIETSNRNYDITSYKVEINKSKLMNYNSIDKFDEKLNKNLLIDMLDNMLMYVSASQGILMLTCKYAYCRSNTYYSWMPFETSKKYALSTEVIKFIVPFKNTKHEEIFIVDIGTDTIFKCGNDIMAFRNMIGDIPDESLLDSIKIQDGLVLKKADLVSALNDIDIYLHTNLTLNIGKNISLTLKNNSEEGLSSATIDVNKENSKVCADNIIGVNFENFMKCLKCMKSKDLALVTVKDRSEFIGFSDQLVTCLLMVDFS